MLSFYLTMYLKYLAAAGCIYGVKKLQDSKDKTRPLKMALKQFINDKEVVNPRSNKKAVVSDIERFKWGFKAYIDISQVVSYNDFEKHSDYLKQSFRAEEVIMSCVSGTVIIEVITDNVQDLNYSQVILGPTELLLGHNRKGIPIIADMKKTPHVAYQGLSNSGKSKAVELMLMNLKGADVVLLNVFKEDFINVNAPRFIGYDNILKKLLDLLVEQEERIKPLYVVIDEVNELAKDKAINKAIQDLLAVGRHYNIYLIAIGQLMLKENCSYKNLFNVRITFKMVEDSTIGAFLGVNVPDNKLMQQEFICYSDAIYKGKTYNYNF